MIKTAMQEQKESEVRLFPDGVITKKSDTLEEYSEKVNKIKQYIRDGHIFPDRVITALDDRDGTGWI